MKKPCATCVAGRVPLESLFGSRPTIPSLPSLWGSRLTALRPTLSKWVALSVAF
jgi:hypothetical protein